MQDIKHNPETDMRNTLNALMTSQLSILRSIKSNELILVNYYIIVMLAAIGFFSASHSFFKDREIFGAIQSLILVFTLWFMYMLFKERESYYNLVRSSGRIQNYLGLFGTINSKGEREGAILSLSVLDAGFPKGFGIYKTKNGTKPRSSFLGRIVIIMVIYGIFLTVSYNNKSIIYFPRIILLIIALVFAVDIFVRRDPKSQKRNVLDERGLLGFEDDWAPNTIKEQDL